MCARRSRSIWSTSCEERTGRRQPRTSGRAQRCTAIYLFSGQGSFSASEKRSYSANSRFQLIQLAHLVWPSIRTSSSHAHKCAKSNNRRVLVWLRFHRLERARRKRVDGHDRVAAMRQTRRGEHSASDDTSAGAQTTMRAAELPHGQTQVASTLQVAVARLWIGCAGVASHARASVAYVEAHHLAADEQGGRLVAIDSRTMRIVMSMIDCSSRCSFDRVVVRPSSSVPWLYLPPRVIAWFAFHSGAQIGAHCQRWRTALVHWASCTEGCGGVHRSYRRAVKLDCSCSEKEEDPTSARNKLVGDSAGSGSSSASGKPRGRNGRCRCARRATAPWLKV